MIPFAAMNPAKPIAAAVALAACQPADESCGFRSGEYRATFELIEGPCVYEPPRIVTFAAPPPGCTQVETYAGCNPTIQRVCQDGALSGLFALRASGNGYVGTIQETHRGVVPPVVCQYLTELRPL